MDEINTVSDAGRLQSYFGLSYATWLTLPRVLMEAMPDEWQAKMAALLFEIEEAFPGCPPIETRVQLVAMGQFVKAPAWLSYRHPNKKKIDSFRVAKEDR